MPTWIDWLVYAAMVAVFLYTVYLGYALGTRQRATHQYPELNIVGEIGYYVDFAVRLIYVSDEEMWIAQSTEWNVARQDKDAVKAFAALTADVIARMQATFETVKAHEIH